VGDEAHPYNVFDFTLNRGRDGPKYFLRDYNQVLLADAYGGYNGVVAGNQITRAGCWAHWRRKVIDAEKAAPEIAYMFDAVSTHGKWWLTKKFAGREKRRIMIEERLAVLTAQHGEGRVPEADILLVIADVLATTSAEKVRRRKRWFVTGEHPRAKELKGLEPSADVSYAAEEPEAEDAVFSASQHLGPRFQPTRAALGQTTTVRKPKTPTPQELRWPCDATPPTCMTPAVSTGEFGVALQRFADEHCVNSKVPVLLKQSATFMARVATLDQKYLALEGRAMCRYSSSTLGDWWTHWAPDANGVLTKGPFLGAARAANAAQLQRFAFRAVKRGRQRLRLRSSRHQAPGRFRPRRQATLGWVRLLGRRARSVDQRDCARDRARTHVRDRDRRSARNDRPARRRGNHGGGRDARTRDEDPE
jgi:hypothetical protein